MKSDPDLEVGGEVGVRLDNSAAKHKLSIRPRRNHADPRARVTRLNGTNCNDRYVTKSARTLKVRGLQDRNISWWYFDIIALN